MTTTAYDRRARLAAIKAAADECAAPLPADRELATLTAEEHAVAQLWRTANPGRVPTRAQIRLGLSLAGRRIYAHRLRELVRSRKRAGEALDPSGDAELAAAIEAAEQEALDDLVPGRPLHRRHREALGPDPRRPVLDRLHTARDDRRYLRARDLRERAEVLAEDLAEARRAERAELARARLAVLERQLDGARDLELAERKAAITDVMASVTPERAISRRERLAAIARATAPPPRLMRAPTVSQRWTGRRACGCSDAVRCPAHWAMAGDRERADWVRRGGITPDDALVGA